MPTDADFLAAIAAAPLDRLPKLVYADWLDENGDPRGQMIRLDQELLSVPPADDRYWHLHTRRGELMDGVPADWLTGVRLGNDAAPLLAHDWPDDVTGRWRTVRAAAERLLGKSVGDVGGHRDLVATNEATLSLTLSPSLREWIAFVADTADPTPGTGFLNGFTPTLRRTTSPNRLVLGGNPSQFHVLNAHLSDDDPRVGVSFGRQDTSRYGGVSELALLRLLSGCHGTGGRLEVTLTLDEADHLRAQLAEAFPTTIPFDHALVYERPGLIVRISPQDRTRVRVVVSACAALPEAEVPAFLLGVRGQALQVSGLFVPAVFREPWAARTTRLPPLQSFQDPGASAFARAGQYSRGSNGRIQSESQALRWYRISADYGHVPAMLELANRYRDGKGVERDPEQVRAWYERAAERGNESAMYRLGHEYRVGQTLPQDHAAAVHWYRKAIDAGSVWALNDLGVQYANGHGVSQDWAEARRLYTLAAEKGDALACDNVGNIYYYGRGVPVDYAEAVAWYRKGAEKGETRSMNSLGNCFHYGRGVEKDRDEALRLYKRAAEKGDSQAYDNLGDAYYYGYGVPVDYAEAVGWYRKAVEKGVTRAMNGLGRCYQYGNGVEKDPAEAFRYYKMSAEAGNTYGMTWTGYAYEKGEGTAKDYTQSLAWYRKAADLGNRVAINNLAAQYDEGNGVAVDWAEAIRLYKVSAGMGHPFAHFNLGEIYELGKGGVVKDLAEALVWYRQGAKLGDDSSKKKLAELTAPTE